MRPGEIRLTGVSRRFRHFHERNRTLKETLVRRRRTLGTDLWVLNDVDLHVQPGDALGVVGRNGIGKSTLLKLVAGIIPPQSGTVEVGGRVTSLLELGAGFHPEFTGTENLLMQAALYGLDEKVTRARMEPIVAFAELADFMDVPVKTYSSGMFMRLAFSIAAHVDADVMLLDEVLAVGDAAFQRKCMGRIYEFQRSGGTILFVSHDQAAVESVCDRAILLDQGRIVAAGAPPEVMVEYNRRLAGTEELDAGPKATDAVLGGSSRGTGRVRIRDVRLLGPDGPGNRIASGASLVIEIDLHSEDAVPAPAIGVDIHGPEGAFLFGTSTRGQGIRIDRLEGAATARVEIPRLPLLDGDFTLSVTAASADGAETFHHIERCAGFTVFQNAPGSGPVLVDARWSVDAPATDRSPAA